MALTFAAASTLLDSGQAKALLVIFLMLAVFPVLCIWLWILWRRRFSDAPVNGPGEAACGRCRYPVRGLSTFTCPECGADLRDVGIIRPGATRAGLKRAMVGWTVLMAVLTFLTVPLAEGLIGHSRFDPYIAGIIAGGVISWFVGLVVMLRKPAEERPLLEAGSNMAVAAPAPAPAVHPQPAISSQPSPAVTRNLSIMFIDIVDFTSHAAAASRDGVIQFIKAARADVQPVLTRRRGAIVKTMGDGFLVTFDSPTEAVLAGIDVQRQAGARNDGQGEGGRVRFRIGIATGEVALEQSDVYGDPVNLAARIQQVAHPGEVFFSESTRHAMTRSEVPHEEAGEFSLKGIGEPVRLYRAV